MIRTAATIAVLLLLAGCESVAERSSREDLERRISELERRT